MDYLSSEPNYSLEFYHPVMCEIPLSLPLKNSREFPMIGSAFGPGISQSTFLKILRTNNTLNEINAKREAIMFRGIE